MIRNRHFHASEDSNAAKKILLKHINSDLKGHLSVAHYDDVLNEHINSKKRKQEFFERCLTSSSFRFFNSMEEVNFIVEGRHGVSDQNINSFVDHIYKIFENATYSGPWHKTCFPKINIRVGDKKEPGLQVADLLLWAVNRSISVPKDETWRNKIKFTTFYHADSNKEIKYSGGVYHLNSVPEPYTEDYPFRFEKAKTHEELILAYINIERFLRNIDHTDFSENNKHLLGRFLPVSRILKKKDYVLKSHDLKNIGRTFIRLFDSLPIYKNVTDDISWRHLFHAKHIASLLFTEGYLHTVRTKNFIQRWRYQQQVEGTLEKTMS